MVLNDGVADTLASAMAPHGKGLPAIPGFALFSSTDLLLAEKYEKGSDDARHDWKKIPRSASRPGSILCQSAFGLFIAVAVVEVDRMTASILLTQETWGRVALLSPLTKVSTTLPS